MVDGQSSFVPELIFYQIQEFICEFDAHQYQALSTNGVFPVFVVIS